MNIAVIGTGYVGLVSAVCFAELGHTVIGMDNDRCKLRALQAGHVPIHEHHLPELLRKHLGQRLTFTESLAQAVRASDVIFVTVGTPSSVTGNADLYCVKSVVSDIARHITSHKLIVEKSTVPVRTCDTIRRIMERNGVPAHLVSIASNPEFLREGTAVVDFLHPDRIVVGVDDAFSETMLRQIYAPLWEGSYYRRENLVRGDDWRLPHFIVTNTSSAELIKYASNAFLAMKISFINAIANIAERVGGEIGQIREGIGTDRRIGAEFLNAGIGYGGSCFPKDVLAFRTMAQSVGYDFDLLDSVMRINQDQRNQFLGKVRAALGTLQNRRIAVLGLAFKAGTDDIRESPAIEIVKALIKEGSLISAFDPVAMPRARDEIQTQAGTENIEMASDPYAAAANADAVLILTEWSEFATLNLGRLRLQMRRPIIIDGRNLYDADTMDEAGFAYYCMGRAPLVPADLVGPLAEVIFEEIA
jgi:UDPglucose 6-dehydrogenase